MGLGETERKKARRGTERGLVAGRDITEVLTIVNDPHGIETYIVIYIVIYF